MACVGVCGYGCGCVYMLQHKWKLEDNFQELVLAFHYVVQESNSDPQAWCQAPINHLVSPTFSPSVFAVLGIQPGILNMLGKRSATEPQSRILRGAWAGLGGKLAERVATLSGLPSDNRSSAAVKSVAFAYVVALLGQKIRCDWDHAGCYASVGVRVRCFPVI